MIHSHDTGASRNNERKLWLALAPTAAFMIAEIFGALLTGSLALLSDATHMATDVFGLAMALAAIRLGRRPPDQRRTFGYERFEILAATANAGILFAVAFYILFEAYKRLGAPPEIHSTAMLIVAAIGLVVNAFSIWLLSSGKDESLNLKGAYLEVWSDFLGSLGVIAAAIVIQLTGLTIVDSIVAVGIGIWVLPRTWILLRDAVNILLEGVPRGIILEVVHNAILTANGVTDVHDLHVWAVTGGKVSLTCHVVAASRVNDHEELVTEIGRVMHDRFSIDHVTVQYERKPCPDSILGHRFI
jgi:cobalt-zinc-cadmium efflux system protein